MTTTKLSLGAQLRSDKLASIFVVLCVITFFSWLYGWFPILHKQVYLAIVSLFVTISVAKHFFTTRLFLLILSYAIVVWFNARAGDEYTFDKEIMDGLQLCMCGGMSYYLMKSDDQRAKKWISILVLLVLIIQTLPALGIYLTSKDTIRNFVGLISHGESDYEWDQLFRMGILEYHVSHSLPVLVPPLIMWLRKKNVSSSWKMFCAISLICIILLAYIYDVTTVQFLIVFGVVTSLLIHPNQSRGNKKRIILFSILLIPFIFSTDLQDGMLKGVETFAEGNLKGKIESARYDLRHESRTGDLAAREELYTQSIQSFAESPVWGTNDVNKIGFHSAIFDRMGAFGLLGIVPYVLILFLMIRYCWARIPFSSRWFFIISIISFIALIVMKNMSRLEEWLMFIVVTPSLLTLSEKTVSSKVKK